MPGVDKAGLGRDLQRAGIAGVAEEGFAVLVVLGEGVREQVQPDGAGGDPRSRCSGSMPRIASPSLQEPPDR